MHGHKRCAHGTALAYVAAALAIAAWVWWEVTRPVQWSGPLTGGPS